MCWCFNIVECVLCDDCISHYRAHHDVLARDQLDARNSDSRGRNVFELVAEKFNDCGYVPVSSPYPKLHLEFSDGIVLRKGEVEMMPEKVKSFFDLVKPALTKIVTN